MKRSAINTALDEAKAMAARHGIHFPEFAAFGPSDWKAQNPADWKEVFDCELGWDVTDFGGNKFSELGLTLFTIRNGRAGTADYPKPYAEKALFVGVDQVTPCHVHFHQMEDIINRGGGDLVMRLNHANADGGLDEEKPVVVSVDGHRVVIPAGGCLRLRPGQGVCLLQYVYHSFWAEKAPVMGWEVSMVNDDHLDNRFLVDLPRFSEIEEDAPAAHILCNEYGKYGLKA